MNSWAFCRNFCNTIELDVDGTKITGTVKNVVRSYIKSDVHYVTYYNGDPCYDFILGSDGSFSTGVYGELSTYTSTPKEYVQHYQNDGYFYVVKDNEVISLAYVHPDGSRLYQIWGDGSLKVHFEYND